MRTTHKVSTAVLIRKISRVYKIQNCTIFIFWLQQEPRVSILDLACVCQSRTLCILALHSICSLDGLKENLAWLVPKWSKG